jgi:hypothetical protein
MDLRQALEQLYAEKKRIENVIASLEALLRNGEEPGPVQPSRRGRKSMSAEERRQVSERMKKYWADRRPG